MSTFEVFLYHTDLIEAGSEETCGHAHQTLEEAWACARTFDAQHPFDVVAVEEGLVLFTCRAQDG